MSQKNSLEDEDACQKEEVEETLHKIFEKLLVGVSPQLKIECPREWITTRNLFTYNVRIDGLNKMGGELFIKD